MNNLNPKQPAYSGFVTKTGKLHKRFRPAAFCDTSLLIDYWNSSVHDPYFEGHPLNQRDPIDKVFFDYLKSDTRTRKIYSIRQKVKDLKCKVNLVYSPACRLEAEEVITSLRFKKYGAEVTDSSLILKKGSKEVGDILSKIKRDYFDAFNKHGAEEMDSNLRMLYWHFFFTTDHIELGLEGILEADIINLSLTKNDFHRLTYLANQQVGLADIFHLITAHRLGCDYFFTLDSDFKRVESDIKELFKLEIVLDPQKMLSII